MTPTHIARPTNQGATAPRLGSASRKLRSVFLSDVHLGSRYAQADSLFEFLKAIEPNYLYLVGDFIDGWRLRRRWYWKPVYSQILSRLIALGQSGTQIRLTPGNHDAFLREFYHDFGFLNISDSFLHEAADGRCYFVAHGDRFDGVEVCAQWLSWLGSYAYETLLWMNGTLNWARSRVGLERCQFSASVKRQVKQAVNFVSRYEDRLTRHARDVDCDGVICGHVHTPAATVRNGLLYFNTGDWVEHRSTLLEFEDGNMALVKFPVGHADVARALSWELQQIDPSRKLGAHSGPDLGIGQPIPLGTD